MLPIPWFIVAKLDTPLLLLNKPFAGRRRRALNGRFAHPQAARFLQRSFRHFGETVLHTEHRNDLFRRGRETLMSELQGPLPRTVTRAALPAVVIAAHQIKPAQQTQKTLAAMRDELRITAALRAHAASSYVPAPFFAARWRQSLKPSLRAHALGPASHTHSYR